MEKAGDADMMLCPINGIINNFDIFNIDIDIMSVEQNNKPTFPQMCNSCNKFYGTEAYQGLCSKCYG